MEDKRLKATARLLEVMNTLRRECPWDREQTFDSLRSNTIEETYELADAITDHNMEGIKEELGDLLLHVVDVSDEDWQVQAETVDKVIAQLGAQDIPRLMVYNKADKCDPDVIPFIRPDSNSSLNVTSK